MTLENLKSCCLIKKGTFEDRPFGPAPLVIKVQSKMFALISIKADKIFVSLKCDPFVTQSLRQQYPAITPGYHLNKDHWNTVVLDGSIPDSEICWMIDHSYELVVKGLTKEEKKQVLL